MDGGELGDEIALLAAQLDAATHRLLTCIRRFDESEEWGHQGAQSCAHWLTWRIGLDTATAREKVRVARALGQLPVVDAALAAGRLSYAKVRAITRVATPENEGRLLEFALFTTGAQMERICRRFRSVRDDLLHEAGDGLANDGAEGPETARGVYLRNLPSGMVRLEVTLQSDEADLVLKAIDKTRDELRALAFAGARPAAAASASRTAGPGVVRSGATSRVAGPSAGVTVDPAEEGTGTLHPDDVSAETSTVVHAQLGDDQPRARPEARIDLDRAERARAGAMFAPRSTVPARPPLPGRSDALLFMAEASLRVSGGLDRSASSRPLPSASPEEAQCQGVGSWGGDRYRVLIHLAESLLGPEGSWEAYLDDGTVLSAEAFRRVSCDGGLVPAVVSREPANGAAEAHGGLEVGRQSRAIPTALRRALWLRDAGCRFPGCANHHFIHGHHIRHWANGGETTLQNLALLCSFHHRLVHEGGFCLRRAPDSGALEWFDPTGRRIPDVPASGLAEDEPPSLLALGERGVVLPLDAQVNACGWDGDPVDYEAVLDALIRGEVPLAAA